jgi:hypothetical protein
VAESLAVGTRDPDSDERIRDGSGHGQIAADRQGRVFVVWQDARLSSGLRDAVLITRSDDGGLTWSAPARVSADPSVAAFIPAVAVTRDGTIGVTYYDFRSNTRDPATLPADYWLARSSDGVNWTEARVDAAVDFAVAPNAGGRFLGDYQGLATVGRTFVPFYGRTNGDAQNRSDIAAAFMPAGAPSGLAGAAKAYRAEVAPRVNADAVWLRQVHENLSRTIGARIAGRLVRSTHPPR